jgi:hypothetical protein
MDGALGESQANVARDASGRGHRSERRTGWASG